MKRIIGISVLLVMVTLMSFAGGLSFNPKGALSEDVQEMAQMEKAYQFYSLLNHVGFTQTQLEQLITAVEKAKNSISSIESEVQGDMQKAVELAKTGDVQKAKEKHDEAIAAGKEVIQIRQTYMDTLKGIITLEQQEKFVAYLSQTMNNAMDKVREQVVENTRMNRLSDEMKEKMQQMGKVVSQVQEQRNPQRTSQMRAQPTLRTVVTETISNRLFHLLLMDENLDLLKEYLEAVVLQNPAE